MRAFFTSPSKARMEQILQYMLSIQKKARAVVFSQRGTSQAIQNKIGALSQFRSQLPNNYNQDTFPREVTLQA